MKRRSVSAAALSTFRKDRPPILVNARYYEQSDADYARDVPGEGYGGWKTAELAISPDHTAVVVMHAWDCGAREEFPGWWRAVEYLPRAREICRTVFPPLLAAVRRAPLALFHVVGGGDYYKNCPGYRRAAALAGRGPAAMAPVARDPILDSLVRFKADVKAHNAGDIARGFARVDFAPEARPVGDEGVAEDGRQLLALCRQRGINHLIYIGFAINWCLLLSPGGMVDMSKHGVMCSTIRQAVTAVENKESARHERHKEEALWRVALAFGYVLDADDFRDALQRTGTCRDPREGPSSGTE